MKAALLSSLVVLVLAPAIIAVQAWLLMLILGILGFALGFGTCFGLAVLVNLYLGLTRGRPSTG